MLYTIWQSGDNAVGCVSLVRGTGPPDDEAGAVLTHTFEASSYNDAMRQRNELLGWEPYRTMLRDDGTPCPKDEGR